MNGDWAGYATSELETAHPGMLAFSLIGCGADANPEREGPRQLELAKAQGHELVVAVEKQLASTGTADRFVFAIDVRLRGNRQRSPSEADLKKS